MKVGPLNERVNVVMKRADFFSFEYIILSYLHSCVCLQTGAFISYNMNCMDNPTSSYSGRLSHKQSSS